MALCRWRSTEGGAKSGKLWLLSSPSGESWEITCTALLISRGDREGVQQIQPLCLFSSSLEHETALFRLKPSGGASHACHFWWEDLRAIQQRTNSKPTSNQFVLMLCNCCAKPRKMDKTIGHQQQSWVIKPNILSLFLWHYLSGANLSLWPTAVAFQGIWISDREILLQRVKSTSHIFSHIFLNIAITCVFTSQAKGKLLWLFIFI